MPRPDSASSVPIRNTPAPMGAGPTRLARITLVLGGARSGKSALAQRLVEDTAAAGLFVATARMPSDIEDAEMVARIRRHRQMRGIFWETIEEPLEIARILTENAAADRPILIDCLTLWLANVMEAHKDNAPGVAAARDGLIAALNSASTPVVLVSNETGLGIHPDNALARAFRDEAGLLNQAVAAAAENVQFVAAGIAMTMKDTAPGAVKDTAPGAVNDTAPGAVENTAPSAGKDD